jgi:outer membrane protein OmpA-like peptidoglycan-associated protein
MASALMAAGSRLPALATSMGPYGLGAASLGAGGAAVATAGGSEALFWNPAAMPGGGQDLGYFGGFGGPLESVQQDLAFSGPVDKGIYAGLLMGDQTFPGADNYHEDLLGAGLSAGIGRWLSVGMVQKLEYANPGALRGWAMDAGCLLGIPLGGTWRLRLGAAASDVFSSLVWGTGLSEDQASVDRVGAAIEAAPGDWLSFEQDGLDQQGNGGLEQWRAGIQVSLFKEALQLRAGATRAEQGSLYTTAGLGAYMPWTGRSLEGDYAIMVPSGGLSVGATRQLIDVQWRFDVEKPLVRAALAQELKDSRGRVRMARIAMAAGPPDVQAWTLTIRDRHGKPVHVMTGSGPLPSGVVWDGKDDTGKPVPADGLSYLLRATRSTGAVVEHHALLAPAADLGLEQALVGDEGADLGVRGGPQAGAVKSRVLLKGASDLAVTQADFDLSGISGANDSQSWELRIVDASGRTVRKFGGRGRPPKSVRWEGTNDLGQPVAESLGTSFEVRVISQEGQERVAAAAPVVSESRFADMERQAPEKEQEQRPAPQAACGVDPKTHQVLCTLYFGRDESELTDSDRDVLMAAADEARQDKVTNARIDGFSDHEGDRAREDQLSQERADVVLKFLVARKLGWQRVTAQGWADTRPVADSDTVGGRARNRRVELRMDNPAR